MKLIIKVQQAYLIYLSPFLFPISVIALTNKSLGFLSLIYNNYPSAYFLALSFDGKYAALIKFTNYMSFYNICLGGNFIILNFTKSVIKEF